MLHGGKVGAADLSLFGRAHVNPAAADPSDSYLADAQIRVGF